MYNVRYNWAHRKARSELPISVNLTFFSLGVTAESLRVKKRSKIGDVAPTRSVSSQISDTRGRPPPMIFARLVRPMNAL